MGHFWCKLHLLANFGTEANKALTAYENTVVKTKNFSQFNKQSGTWGLVWESAKAFHPRGSDEAGVADYF